MRPDGCSNGVNHGAPKVFIMEKVGDRNSRERLERLQLSVVEPRMDKGFMVGFTSNSKEMSQAYNFAIEKVLKERGLTIFHQIGVSSEGSNEPGYHAWEIWSQIGKQDIENLFEEIHKEAEAYY